MGILKMHQRFSMEITLGVSNNKLNHGWIKSHSTESWWGVNCIRKDTGPKYVYNDFFRILDLLTIWYHYLSI